MKNKSILFVTPYPFGKAPSQRFRFEQYFTALDEAGFKYKLAPFIDTATWNILYKEGHALEKVTGVLKGFLKRVLLVFTVVKYGYVFIHREATPIGPPWFEWVVAKVFRRKVIYDFDDAIWLSNTSDNNKIVAGIKWHQKVGSICTWAYKVSCGNDYLAAYASQFNSRTVLNPTTIDTVNLHNQVKDQITDAFVIGWTGTHSTMKYLDKIVPVLQQLEQKYTFEFCVISNKKPELSLSSLVYVPWRKETEISDLLRFNVGIMPLEDDKWAKGKCAFKALQYMSLGIPALVSPVGMNVEVVDHGLNGYICDTPAEWYQALEEVILSSSSKRKALGAEARKKIESHYAVTANRDNFLGLFW